MTNTTDLSDHEGGLRHTGTPDPSSDYDGCFTLAEIDVRYRELWDAAEAANDCDEFTLPKAVRDALGEDYRRAHVRRVNGSTMRRSSAPRPDPAPVVLQPTETTDGLVITCQGPCGETKPATKFPTRSGNRPGREGICRACRDARIAAAKAAKGS